MFGEWLSQKYAPAAGNTQAAVVSLRQNAHAQNTAKVLIGNNTDLATAAVAVSARVEVAAIATESIPHPE